MKSSLFGWFFSSEDSVLFKFNGHQNNFPQKIKVNLKIPNILFQLYSQLLWKLISLYEMWLGIQNLSCTSYDYQNESCSIPASRLDSHNLIKVADDFQFLRGREHFMET